MSSLPLFRPGSVRETAPGSNRFLRLCTVIVSALVLAACATPPGGDADNASDTSAALSTKSAKSKTRPGAASTKADDRGNWNLFGLQDDNGPSQSSIDGLRADMGTFEQRGMASWYGKGFHGRKTANGERFDMRAMTAAHPSLPLDSWVLVRNLRNNKVAVVRINDRGPYHGNRILDLSYAAAKRLSFVDHGATQVEIRRLSRTEVAALGPNIEAGGMEAGDGSGADEVPDTANTLVPTKSKARAKSARPTVKQKHK